jgi:perosamine synthetase
MIPVCEPLFLGNEYKYVDEALKSGWISSSGKFLDLFEEQFSSYCGCQYGIATTSGTTALHLMLIAVGIHEGDEVIVSDFSMVAVPAAVRYVGATPRFVDIEADTWNIDPQQIEKHISPKTKAILVVHTYGHPVDIEPILAIANRHKLILLEDAAEAHGATVRQKRVGSFGAAAAFSFYANKIITTGEGGMVVTSDPEIAASCRYYKNLCFNPRTRDYWHKDLGFNYRMTNVQAALGLAQLEKIDEYIERRRAHAHRYRRYLNGIQGLTLPTEKNGTQNVYWMFGLLIDPQICKINRDTLMDLLKEKNIETRPFFKPNHLQPFLQPVSKGDSNDFPSTLLASERGLYLPSGSGLSEESIQTVSEQIIKLTQK